MKERTCGLPQVLFLLEVNMYYRVTNNPRMINFFDAHGIYPEYEEYENAYYKKTPAFLELLETYHIRFNAFSNYQPRRKQR